MNQRRKLGLAALLAAGLSAATLPAWSTTVQPMTVVHLLSEAKGIVWGKVSDVHAVAGAALPQTQVTIEVFESFRGEPITTFTFNQFGDAAYTADSNGLVSLAGAPGGFPRYRAGEEVVLFMGDVASATGLSSPIALGVGVFRVSADEIRNEVENVGLFTGVQADPSIQTEQLRSLMATTGAYETTAFVDFIREATTQNWTGRGLLTAGSSTGGRTRGRTPVYE